MASTLFSHELALFVWRYRSRHGGRNPSAKTILLQLARWYEELPEPCPGEVNLKAAAELRAAAQRPAREDKVFWADWCRLVR
jgi:hypothetical protein